MSELKHLFERYQRVRTIAKDVQMEILRRLPLDAIVEAGKRMGVKRSTLAEWDRATEEENAVAMDTVLYGEGAPTDELAAYRRAHTVPPGSEVERLLEAMADVRFGLLRVEEILPDVGVRVRDLLMGEMHVLTDQGLAMSATEGMVIATRFLAMEGFIMTTGLGLPLDAEDLKNLRGAVWDWRRPGAADEFARMDRAEQARLGTRILAFAVQAGALDHFRSRSVDGPQAPLDAIFQPAPAHAHLPWDALSQRTPDVPWDTLRGFADSLVSDPSLIEEFAQLLPVTIDYTLTRHTFEPVYIAAVLALAADRLDAATRSAAADLLMGCIEQADALNVPVEGALVAACGTLGQDILPQVLDRIGGADPLANPDAIWDLLNLARDTDKPFLRERASSLAEEALSQVIDGVLDLDWAYGPAWLLRDLKGPDAHDALLRIATAMDVEEFRDLARGCRLPDIQDLREPLPWEEDLEAWVNEYVDVLRDAHEERVEGWDEDEAEDDPDFQRIYELAEAFAASPLAQGIPQEDPDDTREFAHAALHSALRVYDALPEDLDARTVRELMERTLPADLPAPPEVFRNGEEVIVRLLQWLQEQGLLPDAAPLIKAARKAGKAMVKRCEDPKYWSPLKFLTIEAVRRGYDIGDPEQAERFLKEVGLELDSDMDSPLPFRTAPPEDLYEDGDEGFGGPPVTETIHRDSPRIGRNDPCPCGSGKKYKKCCGKE